MLEIKTPSSLFKYFNRLTPNELYKSFITINVESSEELAKCIKVLQRDGYHTSVEYNFGDPSHKYIRFYYSKQFSLFKTSCLDPGALSINSSDFLIRCNTHITEFIENTYPNSFIAIISNITTIAIILDLLLQEYTYQEASMSSDTGSIFFIPPCGGIFTQYHSLDGVDPDIQIKGEDFLKAYAKYIQ